MRERANDLHVLGKIELGKQGERPQWQQAVKSYFVSYCTIPRNVLNGTV